MKSRPSDTAVQVYRNLLISLRLLNADRLIRYSGVVPSSRWGQAIAFHLSERGWSQRQLAEQAAIRPNTLTNLIKHGRDSDTATLARIAAALQIDLAELFLTREQIEILRTHRENRIDRLKEAVLRELSETVSTLVRQEFDKHAKPADTSAEARKRKKTSKR
jgi:transcriptional regulator with XRE-family HTH domain